MLPNIKEYLKMARSEEIWHVDGVRTVINGNELGISELGGLKLVVSHAIADADLTFRNREGFVGNGTWLDREMTELVKPFADEGVCESESCAVEVEAEGFQGGIADEGSIVFTCFARSFKSKEEAETDEVERQSKCAGCHQQMASRLLKKLEALPMDEQETGERIRAMEFDLRHAKASWANRLRLQEPPELEDSL